MGTPRMTRGMNSGAKKKNVWLEESARELPPTAMDDAAMSRPRRRAPPSPMNTAAGSQLWGRNPTQAPPVASATRGDTSTPGGWDTEGQPKLGRTSSKEKEGQ